MRWKHRLISRTNSTVHGSISTWSLRVKQKCWCVVALLVSLVQTRTLATGAPPVERTMWCRGGKHFLGHFGFIVLYLPPKPSGRGEATPWRNTLDAVYKWTDGLLMSLPTRCMPVLVLDLNDRLGQPRPKNHMTSLEVGAGVEGDSATRFGALLRRHSTTVPQTFHLATPGQREVLLCMNTRGPTSDESIWSFWTLVKAKRPRLIGKRLEPTTISH